MRSEFSSGNRRFVFFSFSHSKFTNRGLLHTVRCSLGWLAAAVLLLWYGSAPTFAEDDLDESVRQDVHALASNRLILPGTPIVGLVYDTHSGKLREVTRATRGQEERGT